MTEKEKRAMDDKNEKIIYAKNETLRIVALYSFLFYAVACGALVLVLVKYQTLSNVVTVLCLIAIPLVAPLFFIFAVIFMCKFHSSKKTAKE
ncbi:MAG: hypothetical protein Ta2A_19520 [Treponemataceae bacterium]|nr:MAG: hypothetical protein Ta2A_19520 [Treponemataceae bacterium]